MVNVDIEEPVWFDSYQFWFTKIFEDNYEHIKQEALFLLDSEYFYQHVNSEGSPSKGSKIANQWKIFDLIRYPNKVCMFKGKSTKEYAPITWSLLETIPEIKDCPYGVAYFSLIPARGVVLPHEGPFKSGIKIRHQLCLQLPTASIDDAFIRVNDERRQWKLGKVLTFNESYTHDVKNLTNEDRIVLIYDSIYPST